MVIKYATMLGGNGSGLGGGDGESVTTAYILTEALAYINGLGTLTDSHTIYLCGNFDVNPPGPYHLRITRVGTATFPIFWQGRTADGTADANITIDNHNDFAFEDPVDDASMFSSTLSDLWHIFRNIKVDHVYEDGLPAGTIMGGWRVAAAANVGFYECKAFDNIQSFRAGAACMLLRCEAGSSPNGSLVPIECSLGDLGGYVECEAYTSPTFPAIVDALYKGTSFVFRCLGYLAAGDGIEANSSASGFIKASSCSFYDNDGNHYQGDVVGEMFFLSDCLGVKSDGNAVDLTGVTTKTHFFHRLGTALNLGRSNYDQGVPTFDWLDPMITVDPFVDAAAFNFALNDDPLGGLKCQGRYTGGLSFLGTPTLSCHDIGAIQTKCPEFDAPPVAPVPQGGWVYEYGIGRIFRLGKNRVE